jgi:peptidyl-prolyl cis-trans isomerase A (cyclophilin A)
VVAALWLLAAACGAAEHAGEAAGTQKTQKEGNPVALISTSKGDIQIELFEDKAPITVANFLKYADDGFFDGLIFHRVIDGFMVQCGGFDKDMRQKQTRDPIKNEADNGVKNERGTLAMARTNVVDSATAQFFINLKDNDFLNHGGRDFGYAVFGKVVGGMDVVDAIAKVETGHHKGHGDVPLEAVVIESVKRVAAKK